MTEKFNENKKRILQILGAADKDWNDWKWQLENRITSVHILAKLVSLTDEEIEGISQVRKIQVGNIHILCIPYDPKSSNAHENSQFPLHLNYIVQGKQILWQKSLHHLPRQ